MATLPDHPPPRPTTRQIARLAGVSSTAVSLALRNHPKISAATRARVQRVAAELGYRPDPQVAKLMHHLRTRRKTSFQSTLCALTTIAEQNELPYIADILRSARLRAESLGYGFMVLHIEDAPKRRPDVQRMLRSRGVEGVLLPPMVRPRAFDELLDWSFFSVVTATNGVLAPEFHRVVPHQFNNMLILCEQLARRGYRRMGIVQPSAHDLSTNHGFSAAVAWQNLVGGTELVRPLIYEGSNPVNLKRWFARERPDVIIAAGEEDGRAMARTLGLRIPGPVGFAGASKTGTSIFAGIEERPEEIGATAVGLLCSMVQRGEKGIPAVPTVTMIKGRWVDGASLRATAPRPRRAAATKR